MRLLGASKLPWTVLVLVLMTIATVGQVTAEPGGSDDEKGKPDHAREKQDTGPPEGADNDGGKPDHAGPPAEDRPPTDAGGETGSEEAPPAESEPSEDGAAQPPSHGHGGDASPSTGTDQGADDDTNEGANKATDEPSTDGSHNEPEHRDESPQTTEPVDTIGTTFLDRYTVRLDAPPAISDASLLAYRWTIDGIAAGTGQSIVHQFLGDGTHTVALAIGSGDNLSPTATADIAIVPPYMHWNEAPEIRHKIAMSGSYLVLDATRSIDPDGDTMSVTWTVGDRLPIRTPTATVAVEEPGPLTIRIQVQDPYGGSSTETMHVDIPDVKTPQIVLNGYTVDTLDGHTVQLLSAGGTWDRTGTLITFSWQLGDDAPRHDAEFAYDPTKLEAGASVLLTVRNGLGHENTTRITLVEADGTAVTAKSIAQARAAGTTTLSVTSAEGAQTSSTVVLNRHDQAPPLWAPPGVALLAWAIIRRPRH